MKHQAISHENIVRIDLNRLPSITTVTNRSVWFYGLEILPGVGVAPTPFVDQSIIGNPFLSLKEPAAIMMRSMSGQMPKNRKVGCRRTSMLIHYISSGN